jgi:hypothetical protein
MPGIFFAPQKLFGIKVRPHEIKVTPAAKQLYYHPWVFLPPGCCIPPEIQTINLHTE